VKPITSLGGLHEVEYEHDVVVVVSGFWNSGSRPEHGSVPSSIKLGQGGTCWTKLYVGTTRRAGVYEYDAAYYDTASHHCRAYPRSRGTGSCNCDSRVWFRNAASWSNDDSGPKQRAPGATRKSAAGYAFSADTEPCIWRRVYNSRVERHAVSMYAVERCCSSPRDRTAELDEQGIGGWSTFILLRNFNRAASPFAKRLHYEGWGRHL
jgi:hypothetical protein